VKHTTGIPHSPTGQAIVERANHTIKDYLQRQKGNENQDVTARLHKVLFTLNYLMLVEDREEPAVIIHYATLKEGRPQAIPGLYVHHKNMQTGIWEGP
ncbi:POK6 protein, partial [Rhinopomastus cyanomelas]|nr:POK6 protein [Rhinopomastus cyanomelas]